MQEVRQPLSEALAFLAVEALRGSPLEEGYLVRLPTSRSPPQPGSTAASLSVTLGAHPLSACPQRLLGPPKAGAEPSRKPAAANPQRGPRSWWCDRRLSLTGITERVRPEATE